jgi:hypothetical protein
MARWFIVRVEPNADAIRFNQHGTIFGGTLADFDVICFKYLDFHLYGVVCIVQSIINFPGKLKMMGNLLFGTNNKNVFLNISDRQRLFAIFARARKTQ